MPGFVGPSVRASRIAADIERRISVALKACKETGDSVRKIAARFGVDPSTVQRISRPLGQTREKLRRPQRDALDRILASEASRPLELRNARIQRAVLVMRRAAARKARGSPGPRNQ
jgi:transposase-like protein